MLKLSFHGASGNVTGSCYLLESRQASVLIDCGMFQGSKSEKELNYRDFPFDPGSLDAVILTHAHIDHSGLLPKLVKNGYAGPIYSTRATADLCSVMLPDSAYIQEMEVVHLNRRNAQRGRDLVEPIYAGNDALACLTLFRPLEYGTWGKCANGMRGRFWNAGHLLGSSSIELEVDAGADLKHPVRILFSGDLGPDQKVLQRAPHAPQGFDYIICESTYGDIDRAETLMRRRRDLLRDEVQAAIKTRGALIVPSFAVERTQEFLVDLVSLVESGELPQSPIFIDSPLATKASSVFEAHAAELENGVALVRALNAPYVRFTEGVEQSKAISRIRGFHIVIAASGMCEAGKIRHHLKAWLWRSEATVLIIGYQAQGTLGRILQDGAEHVRIQGEDIQVKARIRSLDLYSGHADANELCEWVKARLPLTQKLFVVHGEEQARSGLQAKLGDIVPVSQVILPQLDDVYDLGPFGARLLGREKPRRLDVERVGRLDWHNDMSRLILDINDAVAQAPDEKSRSLLIRRLRRALDGRKDV